MRNQRNVIVELSMGKMKKKEKFSFPPLKGEAARLVNYWIALLQEGERASFVSDDLSERSLECPLSEIVAGLCSPHVVRSINDHSKVVNTGGRERKNSDEEEPDELRVLISPIRFVRHSRDERTFRNSSARVIDILWVPATLDRKGRLAPPLRGGPWIHREVLEPPVRQGAVTIGLLDDLEKFAERTKSSWSSWAEYWDYSVSLLSFVSGQKAANIEIEGYRRIGNALLALDRGSFGASSSCIGVLKDVLNGKRAQGLLPSFTALVAPPARNYSNTKGTLARSARRHGAQFGNRFPLSASQRQALHRFIETPSKDFLCVTGPPGTG
jgi:hypothetical protein